MDKYGLIGYPLGHSFSISYFNEKFQNEGINARYINFEIPNIEQLPEIVAQNPDLQGLNVTIPYKQKVMQYLDTVSPEARAIGAVNVIKVVHKGKNTLLKGYNSDVIGFTRSIEPLLTNHHQKALILGTGGAAKAISYGLRSLGLQTLFVSRYERPTNRLRPMSSMNTTSSSTAHPSACTHGRWNVRICPTRLSTAATCSTTCSTTPTRHSLCTRDANREQPSRTDWKCSFCKLSPVGKYGTRIWREKV